MKKVLLWLLCTVLCAVSYVHGQGEPLNKLVQDLENVISPGDDKVLTAADFIETDEQQGKQEETEVVEATVNAPRPQPSRSVPATTELVPQSETIEEKIIEEDIEPDQITTSEVKEEVEPSDQAITPVIEKQVIEEEVVPFSKPGKKEAELVVEDDDIVEGFLRDDQKTEEPALPAIATDTLMFNINKKRQEVAQLVDRAVQELKTKSLDVACNRFTHTKEFIHGDLYIFVYDTNGTCLAHGDDAYLLWQNKINLTDWVGTPIVKQIIKKAQSGGGWVTYGWHNSTKVAYVRLVEKEGKAYVVGSGFFPHSKEEAVVNLVKGGVALFNQVKKANQPIYWAFSRMSYPSGSFVAGNLYLYALDFKGNILAQGERPGLINTNSWDYQDEKGLYVNREIIKKLETSVDGIWIEYISKRAPKKAYAEKVVDNKGNKYFIACGYYPDANRQATIDLVRKGYTFMKTSGKTSAVQAFSQRSGDDYRYGDLFLVVYDMKGKIIADGGNADNIGRNMSHEVDQDGFPYIQRMIKRATKEGIWSNAKINGYFQSTYAQKIDLGVNQFVITCSYYPVSKPETMMLLVQSGVSYLRANPREEAFAQFVRHDSGFRRGDLQLIVVDTSGICYAYGDDVDLIWRNIFDVKDDAGRPFIKMFINEVRQGPTVIKTKLNGAIKTNYVTSLEKGGKTYVISSGYYQ